MRLDKEIVLRDKRYTTTGGFVVKSLTNSTVYRIGGTLSEAEAKELCSLPIWTVTVIAD